MKLVLHPATPAVGTAGAAGYVAAAPEVAMGYGKFITAAVKFAIVALVLFLVIKGMNRMKKQEEAAAPPSAPPPEEITLLREIRDALRK